MNFAWNLTESERLTPYYDSADEVRQLAGFQQFFDFERGQSRIECVRFNI